MTLPVYTPGFLAVQIGGVLTPSGITGGIINELQTDSRNIVNPSGSLFIALITPNNDGHKYIGDVYQKGVRCFLVSSLPQNIDLYPLAQFILVKDTLAALQKLCSYHRLQFDIPVIGITGSNGKTVVKEWLFQLISPDKRVVRSPKSFNSQLGVPMSVWKIQKGDEIGIFEAGISKQGEMENLREIIRPTMGLITNIGHSHDENFISKEQKTAEKLALFKDVSMIIFCEDHHLIRNAILSDPVLAGKRKFTWGNTGDPDLKVNKIRTIKSNLTSIGATFHNQACEIEIPFSDSASVENALHCWSMMLALGYPQEVIKERMAGLHPIAMRLEMLEGINNCTLINDIYNSDIESVSIAVDFLNQQNQHRKKTVIISDILQSGKDENQLYSRVAEILVSKDVQRVIGIGKAISRQAHQFTIEKSFYASTEEFLRSFPLHGFANEVILLKGARDFRFENISNELQQKAHETRLEINLNALVNNLNFFRQKVLPGTKIMAMVKAFSYGSGSFEIANSLQYNRVDYLAVAYADEGVELRKAGIHLPVMVMNPDEESIIFCLRYNLEPEIYSLRILQMFIDHLGKDPGGILDIHIKLDTGMHRLGFGNEDIPALLKKLIENPGIRVKSVFSHLAAADKPEEDGFTHRQISLFEEMSRVIIDRLQYPVFKHILNSAGILRFPEFQYDMVRLGISLYGVSPTEAEQPFLETVSSWKTIISQIKNIAKGESVGYDRKFIADRPAKIAVIPVGYADGLNRRIGNGRGGVYLKGAFCPFIGNICMDMSMIDITGIQANEGDTVDIFDHVEQMKILARDMGTIPYEILTGISRRVKRVYHRE